LLEPAGVPSQGFRESKVVEDPGPQIGGDASDFLDEFVDPVPDYSNFLAGARGSPPLNSRQVELQPGQGLAQYIVHVPGNAAPFLLDQEVLPRAKLPNPQFGLASSGDVGDVEE
jgi:hypothetical protein